MRYSNQWIRADFGRLFIYKMLAADVPCTVDVVHLGDAFHSTSIDLSEAFRALWAVVAVVL